MHLSLVHRPGEERKETRICCLYSVIFRNMLSDLQCSPTTGWQQQAGLQMLETQQRARAPSSSGVLLPRPHLARPHRGSTTGRDRPCPKDPRRVPSASSGKTGEQAAALGDPPNHGMTDGRTDGRTGLTWDVVDGYSEDHQHNPPPAAAAGRRGSVPGRGECRGAVWQAGPRALPPLVGLPVLTFIWGHKEQPGQRRASPACPPRRKKQREGERLTKAQPKVRVCWLPPPL